MINETSVRCFLETADTLNFSTAANRLYMTQQAVSRQIVQLELDLGVKLFLRTRQTVVLTEEGRQFQTFFQRVRAEFEMCCRICKKREANRRNELVVGHQEGMNLGDFPTTVFWRMRIKYPEFNTMGEVYPPRALREHLLRGNLNLILLHRGMFENFDGLAYRVLYQEIPVVLFAARALASKCPDACWSDFRYEPLIVEAGAFSGYSEAEIRQFYGRYGLTPQRILIRPDLDSLCISVAAGQGIAIGSRLSQIDMRLIKPYDTGYYDELLCLWRPEAETPLLRDYIDGLADVFSGQFPFCWEL